MEVKCTVKEKLGPSEYNLASTSYRGVCRVSCKNIVAFTRVLYHPNPIRYKIPMYTAYVADVNTPYEAYVVMESFEEIKDLVFDSKGEQLLIVSVNGSLRLYVKGSSLNAWKNTHTAKWAGENILHANFFCIENKPVIQKIDGRGNVPYLEKFSSLSLRPTLVNIGESPQNGFFVVTASGLVIACAIDDTGLLEQEATSLLGRVRDNFLKVTASLTPSGEIHIATWKPDLIRIWNLKLKYTDKERSTENKTGLDSAKTLETEVTANQAFVPSMNAIEKHNEFSEINVTQMMYPELHDPDNLLVCVEVSKSQLIQTDSNSESASDQTKNDCTYVGSGSVLVNYRLIEKPKESIGVWKNLLPNTISDGEKNIFKVKTWIPQSEWVSPVHRITSVAVPDQISLTSLAPPLITLSTSNGSIMCLNREKMSVMCKTVIPTIRQDDMPPPKRPCSERYGVSMCSTWTGLHLLILDTEGSLHLNSLLRQSDFGSTWHLYIMLLLEYALISGYDWLDVLLAMPTSSTMTLSDCISETFYQHPGQLVQHLCTRFLVIKHSVMRLTPNLQTKSIEVRLQAHLSAITKMFRLFRPISMESSTDSDATPVFQGFVENRSSLETLDVDKALDQIFFSSNILDCQIDPNLLQDLQTCLQFSADLSLYLFLLLVHNQKYDFIKDPKILSALREILLTSRAWHRHRQLVYPQMLCKSDSIDVWATLYRLLTKLSHILPNEPDAAFLDECSLLDTQVACKEVPLYISPRGILGCISLSNQTPFPIQFTQEQSDPNSNVSNVNPRSLEGCIQVSHPFDSLNNRYLGGNFLYMQCTRCFSARAQSISGGSEFSSMWEQEWDSMCLCGGHWAPISTSDSPRSS